MKKMYMKPASEILVVEIQSILDGSVNMGGNRGTFNSASQTQLSRESDWEE